MLDREIARNPLTDPGAVPSDVTLTRAQLEPDGYVEEWIERDEQWRLGTPHYYDDFVARYPERLVTTLEAVADAGEGGVLVHCRAGRDRCGLAIAMILDLVGVDHAAIAADHWQSYADETTAAEGADGLLEGRRLQEAEHAQAIHRLLAEHPAAGCFTSAAEAEAVRSALTARLT
jgi:microsomal dipeptidase-like Zn-dependent dipeptidase